MLERGKMACTQRFWSSSPVSAIPIHIYLLKCPFRKFCGKIALEWKEGLKREAKKKEKEKC